MPTYQTRHLQARGSIRYDGTSYYEGDVFEAAPIDAAYLIRSRRADPVDPPRTYTFDADRQAALLEPQNAAPAPAAEEPAEPPTTRAPRRRSPRRGAASAGPLDSTIFVECDVPQADPPPDHDADAPPPAGPASGPTETP